MRERKKRKKTERFYLFICLNNVTPPTLCLHYGNREWTANKFQPSRGLYDLRGYVAGTSKGLLAGWRRDPRRRARGFGAGSPPYLFVSRRYPEGVAGGRVHGGQVGREMYINTDAFSLKAAFAYPPFQICFRKSEKKKRKKKSGELPIFFPNRLWHSLLIIWNRCTLFD